MPTYEQNTTTCDVCGAKPTWPCKTKRGNNMKHTHATMRFQSTQPAKEKKPRRNARRSPATKPTTKADGVTVEQLGEGKDWGGEFEGEWGSNA